MQFFLNAIATAYEARLKGKQSCKQHESCQAVPGFVTPRIVLKKEGVSKGRAGTGTIKARG